MIISVGIDVAKDKHDCFIMNSEGEVLEKSFTITNNKEGFDLLLQTIRSHTKKKDIIKVGLEATGHYSYNILGFLLDNDLPVYLINPLQTNLYRKGQTLRKTKTDKVDSRMIASFILSNVELKPYSRQLYHMNELKSLTRYRQDLVKERGKLKTSVSRLVNIVFPELETLFSSIHLNTVYDLLTKYPGANFIADANLTALSNLVLKSSKGKFKKDFTVNLRETARKSIGTYIPAQSLELKQTINHIQSISKDIDVVDKEIDNFLNKYPSVIRTIPGFGNTLTAIIISEIGDVFLFDSPDKLLAFAGCSPTMYQSGKLESSRAKMEKRGSKYLRHALFLATARICTYDPMFKEYLDKKRKEGKHYFVALSHATKKLVRVIYHMIINNEEYILQG